MCPHSTVGVGSMYWFVQLLRKARWVEGLAYLICICFFTGQTYKLVENLVAPTMTHTYVRELPLKDIDFPLDIKICVRPSLNSTALNYFGYNDTYQYRLGINSNVSHFGWGGHSKETRGAALTSAAEVLKAAKLNLTKDILKDIYVSTHEDQIVYLNMSVDEDLARINQLHDCLILNLNTVENVNIKDVKKLYVTFHEVAENTSVELKLQSKGLTSHREIQEHRFFSIGEPMKLKRLTTYIVKIRSQVFVEEDQSQTCRNYPTYEFASYMDCDDQFLRKRIDQFAPGLNLTPVWLTDDIDLVTTEPVPLPASDDNNHQMLGAFT